MNATTATPPARPMSLRFRLKMRPHIDRLGTIPDRDLAEQIGVSRMTVQRYRESLGIAPFRPPSPVAPYEHLVGVMFDADLAKMIGCSVRIVAAYRYNLGIKPAPRYTNAMPQRAPQRTACPKYDRAPWLHMLGTVPDRVVAEASGAHIATVRGWRIEAGIPAHRPHATADAVPSTDPGKRERILREKRERSKDRREQTLTHATKWAAAWDEAHDRPFYATTYADDVNITLKEAVRRIEISVARGQITEIDRHRPGVCGCYVVGA